MPGRYCCPTDAAFSTIARRACPRTAASTSGRSMATAGQSEHHAPAGHRLGPGVRARVGRIGRRLHPVPAAGLAAGAGVRWIAAARRPAFPSPRTSATSAATAGFPPRPRGRSRFGPAPPAAARPTWCGSTGKGKRLGQFGPSVDLGTSVQLSPDGKRVVINRGVLAELSGALGNIQGARIWTAELSRGIFSRLTTGEGIEGSPAISPDGRVAFTSALTGVGDLYWTQADGTGTPEPLLVKSPTVKHPNGFSPDGRFLIYDDHTTQRQDLWILPIDAVARWRAQADSVSRHAGGRDLRPVLARRAVDRLQLRRIGTPRGVRAGVCARPCSRRCRRQVADVHGRRGQATVEPRRQGAVLPRARPEADGRAGQARTAVRTRRRRAAVRDAGNRVFPLRRQPRRAVSRLDARGWRGGRVCRPSRSC